MKYILRSFPIFLETIVKRKSLTGTVNKAPGWKRLKNDTRYDRCHGSRCRSLAAFSRRLIPIVG